MRVYTWQLKNGIVRTGGFEEKGLAQLAVNTGLKCGHLCTYCSTGAVLRRHKAFKQLGLNPFENGYAIIDPDIATRVALDAIRKRQAESQYEELYKKIKRWTYGGKPTKKAQKLKILERRMEGILETYEALLK